MSNSREVRCPNCNTLFGVELSDGSGAVLSIKHRDLYRTTDGNIWGPCRRCGNIVRWPEKALG